MKRNIIFLAAVAVLTLTAVSCGNKHFISDSAERSQVETDLVNRVTTMPVIDVFNYSNLEMTTIEREAMDFLYAYMPMADVVGHDADFFLQNIRTSFEARETMPWGNKVPEREFRHFVLPVRVNNEDLDSARWLFYNELRPRVENLSMHDAVLAVNHWCHEKVVYTPADPRTSSPLATVRTAYGRCGEESTFAVAALRSVGIPARQVYTPRWAHTDNNHAWVEAWVDGEWMFLGACEPEPVLNLAWFNAPASRGMLMHTKVFGRYCGPEDVMSQTDRFTEINVIDNYAPSAHVDVEVLNVDGTPAVGAKVQFRLYNYAEFYNLATKQTDERGHTSLSAGIGDLVVWASQDDMYGFEKVSFGKMERVTVNLSHLITDQYSVELDIVPPVEGANMPAVTPDERAENSRLLSVEDSIRNSYTATFYTEVAARGFAVANGYTTDDMQQSVAKYLVAARGNYAVITKFLTAMAADDNREVAINLLATLLPKDLRDVSFEVLMDNVNPYPVNYEHKSYDDYIRCPRVDFELLTPYKGFFRSVINHDSAIFYQMNPKLLVDFVRRYVTVDTNCNLGGAPISPIGVWQGRVADARSRDIFFVALARSLDIASRIDMVTGKVQLMHGATPQDVDFEVVDNSTIPTGTLRASYTPTQLLPDPKYYNHFSISRILPEGGLHLLAYDEEEVGMEQGASWSNLLRDGTPLDTGSYLLVTGNRLANGGVLATARAFTIREGETTEVELVMRHSDSDVEVIGEFNSESLYLPVNGTESQSVLSVTGRGYFVVAVLGVNQEPTNHALRDIAVVADKLEAWGRQMILLFPSQEDYAKFDPADFGAPLPKNITYGVDIDRTVESQLISNMKLYEQNQLPIFVIADTFNRVVFCSQGYTINLGEQLLNTINRL